MSNVRIVFNRANIDAVCSAAMIITTLRQMPGTTIECVPYSATSYNGPNSSNYYTSTYLIGVFLNINEIMNEKSFCNNLYFITNSKPTDQYRTVDVEELHKHSDGSVEIYSSSFIHGVSISSLEDSYSSCMSKLTRICLTDKNFIPVGEDEIFSNMFEVASAMEAFVGIKNVSAEQILIVHENYDTMVESAYTGKAMEFKGQSFISDKVQEINGRKNTIKGTNQRIFKSRNFIQSSMTTQHYKNAKSSIMAQTIQISEEYLYDVIRLASYPYQIVVAYQDHKNSRHWWIYSSTDGKARNLVSMIPHSQCFTDGEFIHLISDIPKIEMQ